MFFKRVYADQKLPKSGDQAFLGGKQGMGPEEPTEQVGQAVVPQTKRKQ